MSGATTKGPNFLDGQPAVVVPRFSPFSSHPQLVQDLTKPNPNADSLPLTREGTNQFSPTSTPSIPTAPPEVDPGEFAKSVPKTTVAPATPAAPAATPAVQNADTVSQDDFIAQIKAAALPNVLNDFYNCTYHFRLFVAADTDLITQTSATNIGSLTQKIADGSVPQITIAETGVTGYNIKEVTINALTSQNEQARANPITTLSMVIVEPLGLSFLDGFVDAAAQLDIQNFTKAIYYLELSFRGYDESGRFVQNPAGNMGNGGRWIWALTPQRCDVKINEGSATYTLSFSGLGSAIVTQDGHSHDVSGTVIRTQQAMTVRGNDLKTFCDNFAKQLTAQLKVQYGGDVVTYAIVLNPITVGPQTGKDPNTFKTLPQQPDNSVSYNDALSNLTEYAHQVGSGTSVTDFLLDAFTRTEDGQKYALDNGNIIGVDQSQTQVNERGVRESTLWTIEPTIVVKKYDPQTNTYTREVTFYVTPHYTVGPILSPTQVDNARDPARQRYMFGQLLKYGFLQKEYDYIFTGLNTEVLDLNLDFNFAWASVMPRYGGANATGDQKSVPARKGETSVATGNQKEARLDSKAQNLQIAADTGGTSKDNVPQTAAAGRTSFTPATTQPDLTNATASQGATAEQILHRNIPFSTAQGASAEDVLRRLRSATTFVTPQETPTTEPANAVQPGQGRVTPDTPAPEVKAQSQNKYIEDILAQSNFTPLAIKPSFWQGNQDTKVNSGGGVGEYHINRSVVGALLEQAYAPIGTAKFQTVEMTVRGDPFWLGQTNLHRDVVLRSGDSPAPTKGNLPDWATGKQNILLTFRYPRQIGEDFKPILQDSVVFNGIYQINRLQHIFADGVFKQKIQGNRLLLYDLQLAMGVNGGSGAGSSGQLAGAGGQSGSGGKVPGGGNFQSAIGSASPSFTPGNKDSFIQAFTPMAMQASAETGIDARIILAQAGTESGWGAHAPNNNLFGVNGPGQNQQTTEFVNGVPQTVTKSFATYDSTGQSFAGYSNFINNNPRYQIVKNAQGDLLGQANALQAAHYAGENPTYGQTIFNTAQSISLNQQVASH